MLPSLNLELKLHVKQKNAKMKYVNLFFLTSLAYCYFLYVQLSDLKLVIIII